MKLYLSNSRPTHECFKTMSLITRKNESTDVLKLPLLNIEYTKVLKLSHSVCDPSRVCELPLGIAGRMLWQVLVSVFAKLHPHSDCIKCRVREL